MKRRSKLNLTIVAFLLFAAGAFYFILHYQAKNSFQIEDNQAGTEAAPATSSPSSNSDNKDKTAPDDQEKEKTPAPEEKTEPAASATDLNWVVEKYKGKEITRVSTSTKAVAFTFDAGANADGVDKVLPILQQNGIKGTFFLTGRFIEKYPQQVEEIVASGGDVGNHTYDHPYLTKLSSDQIGVEISGAEKAFAQQGGKFLPFLRSPYGDRNASTLATISQDGYINIRWTVDSLGWEGTSGGQSKNSVRDRVLKNAAPGAIIMMHLGSNPDDKTHLDSQALPEVIAQLKAQGYQFVTLSQLIELGK